MAEFLSDEWYELVVDAATGLPEVDGVDFSFDIEVTESVNGKVRAHGAVVSGRIVSLAGGKFIPENKGERADVSFVAKAKRLEPIIAGQVPPLVAYMRGELKIEGAYERVVDHLANGTDGDAWESLRSKVADSTTSL